MGAWDQLLFVVISTQSNDPQYILSHVLCDTKSG